MTNKTTAVNGLFRFAGNSISHAFNSFMPAAMSPFVRRNYQHEWVGAATWPVSVSMIEGAVTGIIAKKAFADTPNWIIATITAAPVVSNVTSSIWTKLAHGQNTVRTLVLLQLGVILMIGLIAFIPLNMFGLYAFTAAVIISRMFMAGVITIRSVLWRANYSRKDRARVTGKLITIQTLIVASVTLGLGKCMDYNENSFRIIYPVALIIGLIGVRAFSRIRVRHPFLITAGTYDNNSQPLLNRTGSLAPYALLAEWGGTIVSMVKVLQRDLAFRGYMVCMFILGISNLAITAPLIQMTTEKFELSYTNSILCLQSIPLAIMPLAIPLWSILYERVHVIRFRVIHSWVFITAHVLTFMSGHYNSFALLLVAQTIRGIGFGGGALAWNIGHNDFASRQHAGLYMTIHVTLTGVRGLIGAYLGIFLYSGMITQWYTFRGLEEDSFLFWTGISITGALGFIYLDRKMAYLTDEGPSMD